MIPDASPLLHKHAQELRDMWQCRCLVESKGKLAVVVLAVISHSYPNAMKILLRVAFPGFRDIQRPFISSPATIVRAGKVAAWAVDRAGLSSIKIIYETEAEMIKEFRDLADRLKLSDAERTELTSALRRWVVADQRINHLGEKVA